jgi:hypothetical protein
MDSEKTNSPPPNRNEPPEAALKRFATEGQPPEADHDDRRNWPDEPDPDPENHASHRAPNQAETTRRLKKSDGSRLPLSSKRWRKAKSFLRRSQQSNYWKYRDDADIEREPEDLEMFKDRHKYDPELHKYFNFRIDYYPGFENEDLVDGIWFADINDEMIEAKFPRDMDVRAFISAYHISVRRNQWLSIFRKRIWQVAVSLFLIAPIFIATVMIKGDTADGASQGGLFSSGLGGLEIIMSAISLFLAIAVARTHLSFLNQQLTQVMQGNAQTLNAKIQRRLNVLRQNFTRFYKAISEEEFSGANSQGAEWTDRARWWTRLAMWNPKRIEYIEKFLQSEMQRIRVFRRWSDAIGNMVSLGVFVLQAGVILGLMLRMGPELTSLQLWIGSASIIVAALITYISTNKKFSVQNSWIKRWIGDDDWPRFSSIGLDVEIGEIVRRDKDRIRQEKMRGGGFGTGAS